MADIDNILRKREETHGPFRNQAGTAQHLKAAMQGSQRWEGLPNVVKEALEMIAVKMSRIIEGDYSFPDSWLDIEGYARLGGTVDYLLQIKTYTAASQASVTIGDEEETCQTTQRPKPPQG